MRRDADRAALSATLDLVLRALSAQQAESTRSRGQVAAAPPIDPLLAGYASLKSKAREMAARDPFDALVTVVGTGSVLFYLAEKGKNPKCRTIWDAMNFISSSLSVGYDQLFPQTPAGKAITSFVMSVGPTLATRFLDPPKIETDRDAAEVAKTQRAIVEKLDAILRELQKNGAMATAAA